MVSRKMNQPICFVGKFATFWFIQIFADWHCRRCFTPQKSGSVAFEFTSRGRPQAETLESKNNANKEKEGNSVVVVTMTPKTWICLKCAEDMMKEAQEEIGYVKSMGADAYRLFKALDKEDKENRSWET